RAAGTRPTSPQPMRFRCVSPLLPSPFMPGTDRAGRSWSLIVKQSTGAGGRRDGFQSQRRAWNPKPDDDVAAPPPRPASSPAQQFAESHRLASLPHDRQDGGRHPAGRGGAQGAWAVTELTPECATEARRVRDTELLGDRGDRSGQARVAQERVRLEQPLPLNVLRATTGILEEPIKVG